MRIRFQIFFYIILLVLTISCKYNVEFDNIQTDTILNLKFNPYNTANNNDAKIGLEWALSHIGAKKINPSFGGIIQKGKHFYIDYIKLGFNNNAVTQLERLHGRIKESQEYKENNSIDLGRYVALIIGASEHYYQITNIPKDITAILENYILEPNKGSVNNSSISSKHRVVEYSKQNGLQQLFLTSEIEPATQEIVEYETIEIMENGQLKFGVFDGDGVRLNNATGISIAGKPAKCMWCHESKILPLFNIQNDTDGFLSYLQLKDTLSNYKNLLQEKQLDLQDGVDYSKIQDHIKMELLYISFMEPSAKVLSKEWNMSISAIENMLVSLQTHHHEEFNFLGDLYHRNDLKDFAPYTSLEVSSSIREESQVEVNHID